MSLEFIISVVTYAAPYALCAMGMQLIFLPSRAVNFAQGDLMVLGSTVFAVAVTQWFPGNWLMAFLITVVIGGVIAVVLAWPIFHLSAVNRWGPSHITLCLI